MVCTRVRGHIYSWSQSALNVEGLCQSAHNVEECDWSLQRAHNWTIKGGYEQVHVASVID